MCLQLFGMCGVIKVVDCLSVCTVIFFSYIFEFIKATFDSNNFLTDFFCSSCILLCTGSMPSFFWYVLSDTIGGMLHSVCTRMFFPVPCESLDKYFSVTSASSPRFFALLCFILSEK